MSRTLQIISKYYKLLEEQVPNEQQTPTAAAPTPIEPQSQESGLDENEKYIIKILTNAFIFNPKLFDKSKQKYIHNRIDQISRMVNVPVSRVVDDLKKIIAFDTSLKVESKTIALLSKYIMLIEQPADATEIQPDDSTDELNLTKQANIEQETGEGNELNLEEIFPLYKELIIKALKHTPTEDELMIIKPVVNQFADSDPEKIVEAIQNMLSRSLEDKEVQDNLSNA